MPTWFELSAECLRASKKLLDDKCLRGSVNRSYYAAYCAISGHVPAKMTFALDRNNPPHQNVRYLVQKTLRFPKRIQKRERLEIGKRLNYLRLARVDADYRPEVGFDRKFAIQCLRNTLYICDLLRKR